MYLASADLQATRGGIAIKETKTKSGRSRRWEKRMGFKTRSERH